MINYILTRSKRKTIALYVQRDVVNVRAPHRMPKYEIDRFVVSKEKWIKNKLAYLNERAERRESFSLDYGDMVFYRGMLYPIVQKIGSRAVFDGDYFYVPQGLSPEEIKTACIRIYKKLAKQDLNDKVQRFAELLSVHPLAVKVNTAKSRWGSCSAKKSLNFSWRLIMADDGVIDYVVVHELAHLLELNHSKRFWAIVMSILPDYKERQKRLRALQEKLAGEDW
jgi:hypothetical protein